MSAVSFYRRAIDGTGQQSRALRKRSIEQEGGSADGETNPMIRTMSKDRPVHVVTCEQEIRLGIGMPSGDGLRFTRMSVTQAERLLYALGCAVSRLRERQARGKAKTAR